MNIVEEQVWQSSLATYQLGHVPKNSEVNTQWARLVKV